MCRLISLSLLLHFFIDFLGSIWCCRLYCSDSNSVIDSFLLLNLLLNLDFYFFAKSKAETIFAGEFLLSHSFLCKICLLAV